MNRSIIALTLALSVTAITPALAQDGEAGLPVPNNPVPTLVPTATATPAPTPDPLTQSYTQSGRCLGVSEALAGLAPQATATSIARAEGVETLAAQSPRFVNAWRADVLNKMTTALTLQDATRSAQLVAALSNARATVLTNALAETRNHGADQALTTIVVSLLSCSVDKAQAE